MCLVWSTFCVAKRGLLKRCISVASGAFVFCSLDVANSLRPASCRFLVASRVKKVGPHIDLIWTRRVSCHHCALIGGDTNAVWGMGKPLPQWERGVVGNSIPLNHIGPEGWWDYM